MNLLLIVFFITLAASLIFIYSEPSIRWQIGKHIGAKDGTTPNILAQNIKIETIATGLNDVASLDFIDSNTIIFVEKSKGHVRLIDHDNLISEPLYVFENVSSSMEYGLLGVLYSKPYVYFYVTEFIDQNGNRKNNIYRFLWNDNQLQQKTLVAELPSMNCCHHGGYMIEDHNGNVLATIGDLEKIRHSGIAGRLQNSPHGDVDDTGVIYIVDSDTIQFTNPTDRYYAIGIRNGFGLDVDPFTGNLWDTENGQTMFDEINLIPFKFNSGWALIQGPAKPNAEKTLPEFENFRYSDPEFSWERVVAPTALAFIGNHWGEYYRSYLLVSDYIYGNIYKFKLNSDRNSFVFENPQLHDLVLNEFDDDEEIIFGTGFGHISDMKFSPDGSLYVATHYNNGALFKITLE